MVRGRNIDVQTPHGLVKFNYFISTPTNPDATSIDTSIPTVLFLHPVYIASVIYHPQFSDPSLRRFNLVCADLLAHGFTEGTVPPVYGGKESAQDVAAFMDALKLPACVIVGLSMGTIIGMQLALQFPQKVSALFLISPLGTEEPEDVADGRQQIHDTWREAFQGDQVDEEMLSEGVFGALQLGFNSEPSPLVTALVNLTIPRALVNWDPQHFDAYEQATLKIFTERKNYSQEELEKLSSTPITLVYCLADVAYPSEYMDVFAEQLKEAGVAVRVHSVPNAPHFGCTTHPQIVNPILSRFVCDNWKGEVLPAKLGSTVSPFEERMREAGYNELDSDDEESD
ncbi:alpha/beta-hydrolase [Auriculariales sp. MPI-PUGE-AT-0066]|nr:alpha/beta-hydrolase [Auriculariales sp. MPI-PUGE-AT-0066]